MVPAPKSQSEAQTQKAKLANSYNALLEEFASKELRNVGNYAIGNLIGKGSFGKVYLATHKLINGSKVVLKSANKDDSNLAREIHHHRQFLHPHIARLYEVILTENAVWLVLEYCPGDELYYYLTKHGPIEPEKVQKIFTQLLGAVSYVHMKSCVHRDLKLENILLDKHGDVKLCDFGFTREYEGKSNYLQTWCGTVCYSAPEMLKGEKYAGEKVDVWSLGIILYALLCGELPFDEDDDDKTKIKILKEEPKYPETLPKPAKDLIVSMLSKRPLLRPSLSDILTNPWLADHAPHQQAVLKLQQPAQFSTQLEMDVLQRMSSAGVNIDMVIENVLSQRCDALAGWWALLLEKEERKEKRRARKRKEREADIKAIRRISNASGRLMANTLSEVQEEFSLGAIGQSPSDQRGRSPTRANGAATAPSVQTVTEEQPAQAKGGATSRQEHRYSRTGSSTRIYRQSQLGPGYASKRSSVLQMVATTDPKLLNPEDLKAAKRQKSRYQPVFLKNIRSWFKDASKRTKNPTPETRPDLFPPQRPPPKTPRSGGAESAHRTPESKAAIDNTAPDLPKEHVALPNQRIRPRITTPRSASAHRRMPSHSPSPLTPNSSYRRSSGLRGRKSTSSSVSSIRSFAPPPGSATSTTTAGGGTMGPGHHASHSKASSASSISMGSPSSITGTLSVPGAAGSGGSVLNPHPVSASIAARRRSSPNNNVPYVHAGTSNVKVLPGLGSISSVGSSVSPGTSISNGVATSSATAATTTINGKRVPPRINLPKDAAFTGLGPSSPGLPVFAKRRRSPFKGPMLGPGVPSPGMRRRSSVGLGGGIGGGGVGIDSFGAVMDSSTIANLVRRSNSGKRRSVDSSRQAKAATVIEEVDEEEEDDADDAYRDIDHEEEIEEVDAFSPVDDSHSVEWPSPSDMQFGRTGLGLVGKHSVELEADRPLTKWEVEG